MHAPHFHKLTHDEAKRIGVGLLCTAFLAEAGIAWHMVQAHDVMTATLVVTAWCKEHIHRFVEYVSEAVAA